MKKSKNVFLLIGIIFVSIILFWSILKFVVHLFHNVSRDGMFFLVFNDFLPAIIMLFLMAVPVLLFIRNLKNKKGIILPIISIITNCLGFLWVLFCSMTPAIPQYLIYSKLGLIDTYLTAITSFLANGGWLLIVGYLSLTIGSFLSLFQKEKTEDNRY